MLFDDLRDETGWAVCSSSELLQRLAVYTVQHAVDPPSTLGRLIAWSVAGGISYMYMFCLVVLYVVIAAVAGTVLAVFVDGMDELGFFFAAVGGGLALLAWVFGKLHTAYIQRKAFVYGERVGARILFLVLARLPNVEGIRVKLAEPLEGTRTRRSYAFGSKPALQGWVLEIPAEAGGVHRVTLQLREGKKEATPKVQCVVETVYTSASERGDPMEIKPRFGNVSMRWKRVTLDGWCRVVTIEDVHGVWAQMMDGSEEWDAGEDSLVRKVTMSWSECVFEELREAMRGVFDRAHGLSVSSFQGDVGAVALRAQSGSLQTGRVLSPVYDASRIRGWWLKAKLSSWSLGASALVVCAPWVVASALMVASGSSAREVAISSVVGLVGFFVLVGVRLFLNFVYNLGLMVQDDILKPAAVERSLLSVDGEELVCESGVIRLMEPFSVHTTRTQSSVGEPCLGVTVVQGQVRVAFRVPVQESSWLERQPRLDSAAAEVEGSEFDGWLWPTLLHYAHSHGAHVGGLELSRAKMFQEA